MIDSYNEDSNRKYCKVALWQTVDVPFSLSAFCFVQGMFHNMHRMPTLQMSYYRHNHEINLELERYHLFLGQNIPIFTPITKMILTKAEYHYFPKLQATSVQMAANTPNFVQLLETGSVKAKEAAAFVLRNLCCHSENIRTCVQGT